MLVDAWGVDEAAGEIFAVVAGDVAETDTGEFA